MNNRKMLFTILSSHIVGYIISFLQTRLINNNIRKLIDKSE